MDRHQKIAEVAKMTDDGCSAYYSVLPQLINERGYKTGIEIGVLFGGHAKVILDNTKLDTLVGIDPYKVYEQSVRGIEDQEDFDEMMWFAKKRLPMGRFALIRNTSDNAFDFLWKLRERLVFDFVFIDGLHTYDQLKRDLFNYEKLIRTGGVIACHDYNHPDFPLLTNAVDEFAKEHGAEIIICPFHFVYMNKTW